MKKALIVTPAVLAFLLLAAHSLRAGVHQATAVFLCLPLLFLTQEKWAVRTLQVILAAGSLLWIVALRSSVTPRIEAGLPWLRLVLILGGVAVFTLSSALLLFFLPGNGRPEERPKP